MEWKLIEWEECPECGCLVEVFTDADDDEIYDGDAVRCSSCDWNGTMSVDEHGVAWIQGD